jgi:putative SOS response-associated peptidase YedK
MFRSMDEYVRELDPSRELFAKVNKTPIRRYNIAPGTEVHVIHVEPDGPHISPVHWGWKREVSWPKPKVVQPINARIETIARGRFYKTLFPAHRALIPADGWFEWVHDDLDEKKKQPFFIRLKTRKPMFLAGLAQVEQGESDDEPPGFLIITGDSDTGMLDGHDRRPVVLSPEMAREWLQPDLTKDRAKAIARNLGQPVDDFEWYPVSKDVGNVRNKGEYLIRSI